MLSGIMKRNTKCIMKNIIGRKELILLTVLMGISETEESSE